MITFGMIIYEVIGYNNDKGMKIYLTKDKHTYENG